MEGVEIRTGADELVELVKKRKKISIEEAAKLLGLKPANIQGLVDFLVEDKKFGVEYKFTTPYVYMLENKVDIEDRKEPEQAREANLKDEFYRKTKERNIPDKKIRELWRRYLDANMANIKDEFYEKAKAKKVPYEAISSLWEKYKLTLQEQG